HRRLHALVRPGGSEVRVEVELLAQRDVHRAHPGAELGRERALKPDLVPAHGVERRLRERVAELLERGQADVVDVPLDPYAGRFDGAARRLDDLGARAVTRDEGDAVWQLTFPCALLWASYRRATAIEQMVVARSAIESVYAWR